MWDRERVCGSGRKFANRLGTLGTTGNTMKAKEILGGETGNNAAADWEQACGRLGSSGAAPTRCGVHADQHRDASTGVAEGRARLPERRTLTNPNGSSRADFSRALRDGTLSIAYENSFIGRAPLVGPGRHGPRAEVRAGLNGGGRAARSRAWRRMVLFAFTIHLFARFASSRASCSQPMQTAR